MSTQLPTTEVLDASWLYNLNRKVALRLIGLFRVLAMKNVLYTIDLGMSKSKYTIALQLDISELQDYIHCKLRLQQGGGNVMCLVAGEIMILLGAFLCTLRPICHVQYYIVFWEGGKIFFC